MMGRDHALSGAVAGLAVAEFGLHLSLVPALTLAGFAAAFAALPDLDTEHSCAARSLGFMSGGFAFLAGKVSGGHRHGTHSILGVAVFTALAWAACLFRHAEHGRIRFVLAAFLALAFAAGLRALRAGGHFADLLAIAGAVFAAWHGWGLALVPLACGLGCAAHLAGDALTVEGIPLFWPFTLRHYRLLPSPLAFVTGTWRENCVVAPALVLALGWLAWHGAGMVH
jgi:membrane-bound metal-dependent hydrolase YbcI (DUF457 family)